MRLFVFVLILLFPASAFGKESLSVSVSPARQGSLTLARPTVIKMKLTTPDTLFDASGGTQAESIVFELPEELLFNPAPFAACDIEDFIDTHECPRSTQLGTATIVAYAGPDVGRIVARSKFFFGTGFTVLTKVNVDQPAVIDDALIGSLESSGSRGYGLQMRVPLSLQLRNPIGGIYPVIKYVKATVDPPKKLIRIRGKQAVLPIAGLGPCKRLNFRGSVTYSNDVFTQKRSDRASKTVRCH